jgi:rhodanese-related sulfurtransferase
VKLEQAGYRRVHVLIGGIEAWRATGFAVEGETTDEPDNPST